MLGCVPGITNILHTSDFAMAWLTPARAVSPAPHPWGKAQIAKHPKLCLSWEQWNPTQVGSICQVSSPDRNGSWTDWALAERCTSAVWTNTSSPWSRRKPRAERLGSAGPAEDGLVTRNNKQGVWWAWHNNPGTCEGRITLNTRIGPDELVSMVYCKKAP